MRRKQTPELRENDIVLRRIRIVVAVKEHGQIVKEKRMTV